MMNQNEKTKFHDLKQRLLGTNILLGLFIAAVLVAGIVMVLTHEREVKQLTATFESKIAFMKGQIDGLTIDLKRARATARYYKNAYNQLSETVSTMTISTNLTYQQRLDIINTQVVELRKLEAVP